MLSPPSPLQREQALHHLLQRRLHRPPGCPGRTVAARGSRARAGRPPATCRARAGRAPRGRRPAGPAPRGRAVPGRCSSTTRRRSSGPGASSRAGDPSPDEARVGGADRGERDEQRAQGGDRRPGWCAPWNSLRRSCTARSRRVTRLGPLGVAARATRGSRPPGTTSRPSGRSPPTGGPACSQNAGQRLRLGREHPRVLADRAGLVGDPARRRRSGATRVRPPGIDHVASPGARRRTRAARCGAAPGRVGRGSAPRPAPAAPGRPSRSGRASIARAQVARARRRCSSQPNTDVGPLARVGRSTRLVQVARARGARACSSPHHHVGTLARRSGAPEQVLGQARQERHQRRVLEHARCRAC